MLTEQERQDKYLAAYLAALDEYQEIEKEVKKLGKRLRSLRNTITGLSELTMTKHDLFRAGTGTIVITDESRLRAK